MKEQQSQFISTFLKPAWKRWLWAAVLFAVIFIGIKEASKQTEALDNKKTKQEYKVEEPVGVPDFKPKQFVSKNLNGIVKKVYYYDEVDIILPLFPDGEKAFTSYIQQNIHVNAETKGRVIASFIIEKNGSLTNIKILHSVNAKADQEVIKVLKGSPKWTPGKKDGKAVNVMLTLPVNFAK